MNLLKQIEDAKALKKEMQEELAMIKGKLTKATENPDVMESSEFDAKTEEANVLIKSIEETEKTIANLEVQYEEEKSRRAKMFSTASIEKMSDEGIKMDASPEFLEKWSKSIKTGEKFLSTSDTDAANAFGATIPTYLATEIERKLLDMGTLVKYAQITNIRGILKMAVEMSATDAEVHEEGKPAPTEESITLGELITQPTMIKKWISWSDELEALSGVALADYLVNEFTEKIAIKLESEMLFGKKSEKGLYGIATEAAENAGKGTERVKVAEGKKIDFALGNTALGLLSHGTSNVAFVMNRQTYYNTIMNLTDTTGKPLYGTDASGAPLYNGIRVEFNSAIPVYDTEKTDEQIPMYLISQGAYKINAPFGLAPRFIRDELTLAAEDKVRLVGKVFAAGRPSRFAGIVAVKVKA